MFRPFELEWLGGPAERQFRRVRPGADDLPWGTLDPAAYAPELVERARAAWTESTFNEYCTAAAFAELVSVLLEIGAPIDLVAMAASFVTDEMAHVELNARMAMELGGAAQVEVDLSALSPPVSPGAPALARASELVVRVSCVGEAFSVPMLAGTLRAATHPLTRAVLSRIVADEAPHARFGWLYLDWLGDRLDREERVRLAQVAAAALEELAPVWEVAEPATRFDAGEVGALGWMEAGAYRRAARRAVRRNVVAPLRRHGIEVSEQVLARLDV